MRCDLHLASHSLPLAVRLGSGKAPVWKSGEHPTSCHPSEERRSGARHFTDAEMEMKIALVYNGERFKLDREKEFDCDDHNVIFVDGYIQNVMYWQDPEGELRRRYHRPSRSVAGDFFEVV